MIKTFLIKLVIVTGLALLVGSCSFFSRNDDADEPKPLARVFKEKLYFKDIREMIPPGLSHEDSILFVQNIVYSWGKNQLLLSKAEFNLSSEQKNFDELVKKYRDDLLKFEYQQAFVAQHLDTNITEEEIKAYYENNTQNFELKENIVRMSYARLLREAPKLNDIARLFRSTQEDDVEELKNLLVSYSSSYSLNDTNWISFERLTEIVPVQTYNQIEFLQRNRFVKLEDSTEVFFLRIDDYKIKESVSPLPYVKEVIKAIIINRRKLELLDKMEKKLVEDAYDRKDFEIY